jgi:hypothetical protein
MYLVGATTGAAIAAGQDLSFTVPVGFRPSSSIVATIEAGNGTYFEPTNITIASNGAAVIRRPASVNAFGVVSGAIIPSQVVSYPVTI